MMSVSLGSIFACKMTKWGKKQRQRVNEKHESSWRGRASMAKRESGNTKAKWPLCTCYIKRKTSRMSHERVLQRIISLCWRVLCVRFGVFAFLFVLLFVCVVVLLIFAGGLESSAIRPFPPYLCLAVSVFLCCKKHKFESSFSRISFHFEIHQLLTSIN
jgi:hypothetical protein